MSTRLFVRNRQRTRNLDLRFIRRLARILLRDFIPVRQYELGVHLVAQPEMCRINERFLHHQGPTDVIAFDYLSQNPLTPSRGSNLLHADILICVDEAVRQARRFGTSGWCHVS